MLARLTRAAKALLAPTFEGEDDGPAILLHVANVIVIALTTAVAIATVLSGQAVPASYLAHAVAIGSAVVAEWLLRRGHVRPGAYLLLSLLWGTITAYIYYSGGSASPIVSTYFPVTVLAAVVVGARAGFAVAILSAIAVGGTYVLEGTGHLPPILFRHSVPLAWTVRTAALLMAAGMAYFAIRLLDRSLRRARATEGALRKSEASLAELVRSAPEGIVGLDEAGRIVAFNPAAERIFDREAERALGLELAAMPWESPESVRRMIDPTDLEPQLRGIVGVLRRSDDDKRELELVARRVPLGATQPGSEVRWRLSVRDVTDRRRAERDRDALTEQLHQAQRLESLGLLAGGIAHDFNNLTTVILANSGLLAEDLEDGDDKEMVEEIRFAAERSAGLTQQLLAFGRRQVLEPKRLVLREVVGEMGQVLRRLVPENIELAFRLEDEGVVRTDPGQLSQVLVNLVVNARDAMPEGGTLTIECSDIELEEAERGAPAGSYSALVVRDTGHGMDEATLGRIFEPFFTTKSKVGGTGLGLSVVQGIVAQSDGIIHARSEPGAGTSFHVWLPRVAGVASEQSVHDSAERRRASATILLVEDEAPVRRVVRRILEHAGYEVLIAEDGKQALELAEAHRGAIHILLTDIVMPRIGGVELAERMRERWPELHVVFISGYAADAFGPQRTPVEGHTFLAKPFAPHKLLELLVALPRNDAKRRSA